MTERRIVLGMTVVIVGSGLLVAATGGELAGYAYPGDFLVWTVVLGIGGVVVLRARPGHAIGRLFLWAALASSLTFLGGQVVSTLLPGYALDPDAGTYPDGTPVWFKVFDSVLNAGYVVANILVVAAFARFPEGDWVSRAVKWLFWLSLPLIVAGNLDILPGVGAVPVVVMAIMIARRSARESAAHRRQVAWVLIGYGLYLVIGISSVFLPEGIPPEWLVVSSIILFPAGMVLAITRYKLFELDRLASRTVTYVVVVGVLVAVYFGLVLALRSFVPGEGPLPVALSTLAVAFAFFPLARRVQAFVDRRFFRSRYDAATVVAGFAAELRGTIDEAAVVGRAKAVVDEVFAPESVGVWLAGGRS
jgi:hypothetical protein